MNESELTNNINVHKFGKQEWQLRWKLSGDIPVHYKSKAGNLLEQEGTQTRQIRCQPRVTSIEDRTAMLTRSTFILYTTFTRFIYQGRSSFIFSHWGQHRADEAVIAFACCAWQLWVNWLTSYLSTNGTAEGVEQPIRLRFALWNLG